MRAQVTAFIILGLLFLVAAVIIMYAIELHSRDSEAEEQYIIRTSLDPVKMYVEECLRETSSGPVQSIGLNAGRLLPGDARWRFNEQYSYLAYSSMGAYEHALVLRQDMEAELSQEIALKLERCVDLSLFERQGFRIETGQATVNVSIEQERVLVRARFPIRLSKEGFDRTISEYQAGLRVPLGLLYEKAIEIINAENSQGYFDQVSYMTSNGREILVEKHRPYPDTLYSLTKEGYLFRFALKGEYLADQPGYPEESDLMGCCYNLYDKLCYKHVDPGACMAREGIYDFNPSCECPETEDTGVTLCDGRECWDCGKRRHGESWCDYDAPAGKGYDFVGAQHYLNYCIDGKVYVEECRDFREELCTEELSWREATSVSRAACRPNRWQDCHSCITRECCEDLTYRDCHWKDWLNTRAKCVPYVPPGFAFWTGTGQEVCSRATETKECEGLSCPNIWVDDTAISCYMQGDCGNYRNFAGTLSKGGFINTDMKDKVRDYVYLENGDAHVDLGINNRKRAKLAGSPLEEAHDRFAMLIAIGLNYLDRISAISVSDFLNPFRQPDISVLDLALCDVWQAPRSSDCGACGSRCTEYKCRSLGCEYEEQHGVPRCFAATTSDSKGPSVGLASIHDLEPMQLNLGGRTYSGMSSPELLPYDTMSLLIKTDEPSVCSLQYLPRLRFVKLPSFYTMPARFSEEHNLSFRVPGQVRLPQKAFDLFNITQAQDITKMLENPARALASLKARYDAELRLYEAVTGKDLGAKLDRIAAAVIVVLEQVSDLLPLYRAVFDHLLAEFDNGNYYLFVECRDRAGNLNDEEIFIRLQVSDIDTQPPVILGFSPKNNSALADEPVAVSMYINEPAECRYDSADMEYDDMQHSFECPYSRYSMSAQFGGSYRCSAMMNLSDAYVRCRDNPEETISRPLLVEIGDAPGVYGFEDEQYVSYGSGQIIAPLSMLTQDLRFVIESAEAELLLYIDSPMNCSVDGGMFAPCIMADELRRGLYMCPAKLELESDERILVLNLAGEDSPNPEGVAADGSTLKISWGDQDEISAYVNEELVHLELTIDGDMSCSRPGQMVCDRIRNSTTCYALLEVGASHTIVCTQAAKREFTVECRLPAESERHTNEKSVLYSLGMAPGLSITGFGREEGILYVETSPNPGVRCGYYQDMLLGVLLMQNRSIRHEAAAPAGARIRCWDDYGNVAEIET